MIVYGTVQSLEEAHPKMLIGKHFLDQDLFYCYLTRIRVLDQIKLLFLSQICGLTWLLTVCTFTSFLFTKQSRHELIS